jgi:hypothetical protein
MDSFLTADRIWLVVSGAAGAVAGAILQYFFAQRSARTEARRKFADNVTGKIAELASAHYWPLANQAGTLAELLEDYIDGRAHHLILNWQSADPIDVRLDAHAKDYDDRWDDLNQLLELFKKFQTSNTYLLTHHASGEMCKKLYNTFIANLPAQEPTNGDSNAGDEPAGKDTSDEAAKKRWSYWLRNNPLDVQRAAAALRAYNEVLSTELALLYEDWFQQRDPIRVFKASLAYQKWPDVLTEQSLAAIEYSIHEGALLKRNPSSRRQQAEAPPMTAEQTGRASVNSAPGQEPKDQQEARKGGAHV